MPTYLVSQYYTSLWLSLPSTNVANLFIQSQFMSIFFGLKILKRNFFVAIASAKWSGQVVHLNHAMFFFGVIHKWCHLFSVTFFRGRGSKSQYTLTTSFMHDAASIFLTFRTLSQQWTDLFLILFGITIDFTRLFTFFCQLNQINWSARNISRSLGQPRFKSQPMSIWFSFLLENDHAIFQNLQIAIS